MRLFTDAIKAVNNLCHALVTRDRLLRQIRDNLDRYHTEETNQMSALGDAVAVVKAHQEKIEADVQAVLALLQRPNPDVAAAITALEGIAGEQATTEGELEGAIPPA